MREKETQDAIFFFFFTADKLFLFFFHNHNAKLCINTRNHKLNLKKKVNLQNNTDSFNI